MEFLQKVKPDYLKELQEEETAEETTAGATTTKKGVRTTTITADYDREIVVKHLKKA